MHVRVRYSRVNTVTESAPGTAVAAVLGLWMKKLPGVRISTVVDIAVKCSDVGAQPTFLAPPVSWTKARRRGFVGMNVHACGECPRGAADLRGGQGTRTPLPSREQRRFPAHARVLTLHGG